MSCYDCGGPVEVECPSCHTGYCYSHWMPRRKRGEQGFWSLPIDVGCNYCGGEH